VERPESSRHSHFRALTSHTLEKARDDSAKIAKLIRKLVVKKPTKFIKGWFVTRGKAARGCSAWAIFKPAA
jgi:hypothetical protein